MRIIFRILLTYMQICIKISAMTDSKEMIKKLGQNRMNVTIGSALDLFGGSMKWEDVLTVCREK